MPTTVCGCRHRRGDGPIVVATTPILESVVGYFAEADTSIDVVALYVGSLGPKGSGAEDYSDMMITNARLIADALG